MPVLEKVAQRLCNRYSRNKYLRSEGADKDWFLSLIFIKYSKIKHKINPNKCFESYLYLCGQSCVLREINKIRTSLENMKKYQDNTAHRRTNDFFDSIEQTDTVDTIFRYTLPRHTRIKDCFINHKLFKFNEISEKLGISIGGYYKNMRDLREFAKQWAP